MNIAAFEGTSDNTNVNPCEDSEVIVPPPEENVVCGVPTVTSFEDFFNRLDPHLGIEWITTSANSGSAVSGQTVYNAVNCLDTLNGGPCFQIQFLSGTANPNFRVAEIPIKLINACVNGKSQYAEFIIKSDDSDAIQVNQYGCGVFLNPYVPRVNGDVEGYTFRYIAFTGAWAIVASRNTTGNILSTGTSSFTPNDKWRLEVVPSATKNTLTLFKNAVQVDTVDDTHAERLTIGYPGFYIRLIGVVSFPYPATKISYWKGGII